MREGIHGPGPAAPRGGKRAALLLGAILTALALLRPADGAAAAPGPLEVSRANPRYFCDPAGRVVLLTGSHTWANLQDMGRSDPPAAFDYPAFLDFLERNNHNFFRLWVWEQAKWLNARPGPFHIDPLPFARTGPGAAIDGKPRFDLAQFNESYFARLRERVVEAGRRGIYVAVMLFNGWSIEKKPQHEFSNPWDGHPFHRRNNINGIDADPNGDGRGVEAHTLADPDVLRVQQAYVAKVIDTLNDLPNLLWEISNESRFESMAWQYEMIRFIKRYEAGKPLRHPVGMTAPWPGRTPEEDNRILFESPADWISPKPSDAMPLKSDPPPASGEKVVLLDTDHIWGIGGSRAWIWKAMLRGYNPIYMDPYTIYTELTGKREARHDFHNPSLDLVRRTMGFARALAERIDLQDLVPQPAAASTRYCLASGSPSRPRLLAYLPHDRSVRVDLRGFPGRAFAAEWIHPVEASSRPGGSLAGGSFRDLASPFWGDSLLFVQAAE
jgi:hypothetical protein